MTNINNYDYHVQKMGGGTGQTLPGMFQFSQLNNSGIQSRLKAAGIDTGSRQYKAVIRQMAKDGCTGSMFTCVQAIKNLMKNYNARGEWVEPTTGLTGLLVTDETGDSYSGAGCGSRIFLVHDADTFSRFGILCLAFPVLFCKHSAGYLSVRRRGAYGRSGTSVSGQERFLAGRCSVFCHVYCLYLFAGGRPAGRYGAVF